MNVLVPVLETRTPKPGVLPPSHMSTWPSPFVVIRRIIKSVNCWPILFPECQSGDTPEGLTKKTEGRYR